MQAKQLLTTLLIFLLPNWSCSRPAVSPEKKHPYISTVAENMDNYPVRVLKFHSTNRCQLCLTMETLVKETVMTKYHEQVENGRLRLYIINIDRPENRKATKEYFAFGSALFVSSGSGEKFRNSDITNEAFFSLKKIRKGFWKHFATSLINI